MFVYKLKLTKKCRHFLYIALYENMLRINTVKIIVLSIIY